MNSSAGFLCCVLFGWLVWFVLFSFFSDSSLSHWILTHVTLHFQRHWGYSQHLTSLRATWELVSEERRRHCNKKPEGYFFASTPAAAQQCPWDGHISPATAVFPSLFTSLPLPSPLARDLPKFYKKYPMKGVVYSYGEWLEISVALLLNPCHFHPLLPYLPRKFSHHLTSPTHKFTFCLFPKGR